MLQGTDLVVRYSSIHRELHTFSTRNNNIWDSYCDFMDNIEGDYEDEMTRIIQTYGTIKTKSVLVAEFNRDRGVVQARFADDSNGNVKFTHMIPEMRRAFEINPINMFADFPVFQAAQRWKRIVYFPSSSRVVEPSTDIDDHFLAMYLDIKPWFEEFHNVTDRDCGFWSMPRIIELYVQIIPHRINSRIY